MKRDQSRRPSSSAPHHQGSDRAFVSGFAYDTAKAAPFVSDVQSLEAQVNAIPEGNGGTSLYDAIVTGLYRFRSVQGRKALIVLTMASTPLRASRTTNMLAYARSARVALYFIGIGLSFADFTGTAKMKALAAETGGVTYFIKDVKQLGETYTKLEKRSPFAIPRGLQHGEHAERPRYRTVEFAWTGPERWSAPFGVHPVRRVALVALVVSAVTVRPSRRTPWRKDGGDDEGWGLHIQPECGRASAMVALPHVLPPRVDRDGAFVADGRFGISGGPPPPRASSRTRSRASARWDSCS